MPDGDVHIKQHHSPCGPVESQPAIASLLATDDHHLDRQAHLDIAIEEGASTSQQKSLEQPAPAITPLGEPLSFTPPDQRLVRNTQLDISPQLLPLRSIAVLRI